MIMMAFSVRDKAVGAFLPIFFARSKGEAIRSFTNAVQQKDHQFNQHHDDYALFMLGEYDDTTGVITPIEPERIIAAYEIGPA